MNTDDPVLRLQRIAQMGLVRASVQAKRQPGRVQVRLLRGQAMVCSCCGELLNAGDQVTMPRKLAAGLVRIGDAVIIAD
jgi:hypothetical protein